MSDTAYNAVLQALLNSADVSRYRRPTNEEMAQSFFGGQPDFSAFWAPTTPLKGDWGFLRSFLAAAAAEAVAGTASIPFGLAALAGSKKAASISSDIHEGVRKFVGLDDADVNKPGELLGTLAGGLISFALPGMAGAKISSAIGKIPQFAKLARRVPLAARSLNAFIESIGFEATTAEPDWAGVALFTAGDVALRSFRAVRIKDAVASRIKRGAIANIAGPALPIWDPVKLRWQRVADQPENVAAFMQFVHNLGVAGKISEEDAIKIVTRSAFVDSIADAVANANKVQVHNLKTTAFKFADGSYLHIKNGSDLLDLVERLSRGDKVDTILTSKSGLDKLFRLFAVQEPEAVKGIRNIAMQVPKEAKKGASEVVVRYLDNTEEALPITEKTIKSLRNKILTGQAEIINFIRGEDASTVLEGAGFESFLQKLYGKRYTWERPGIYITEGISNTPSIRIKTQVDTGGSKTIKSVVFPLSESGEFTPAITSYLKKNAGAEIVSVYVPDLSNVSVRGKIAQQIRAIESSRMASTQAAAEAVVGGTAEASTADEISTAVNKAITQLSDKSSRVGHGYTGQVFTKEEVNELRGILSTPEGVPEVRNRFINKFVDRIDNALGIFEARNVADEKGMILSTLYKGLQDGYVSPWQYVLSSLLVKNLPEQLVKQTKISLEFVANPAMGISERIISSNSVRILLSPGAPVNVLAHELAHVAVSLFPKEAIEKIGAALADEANRAARAWFESLPLPAEGFTAEATTELVAQYLLDRAVGKVLPEKALQTGIWGKFVDYVSKVWASFRTMLGLSHQTSATHDALDRVFREIDTAFDSLVTHADDAVGRIELAMEKFGFAKDTRAIRAHVASVFSGFANQTFPSAFMHIRGTPISRITIRDAQKAANAVLTSVANAFGYRPDKASLVAIRTAEGARPVVQQLLESRDAVLISRGFAVLDHQTPIVPIVRKGSKIVSVTSLDEALASMAKFTQHMDAKAAEKVSFVVAKHGDGYYVIPVYAFGSRSEAAVLKDLLYFRGSRVPTSVSTVVNLAKVEDVGEYVGAGLIDTPEAVAKASNIISNLRPPGTMHEVVIDIGTKDALRSGAYMSGDKLIITDTFTRNVTGHVDPNMIDFDPAKFISAVTTEYQRAWREGVVQGYDVPKILDRLVSFANVRPHEVSGIRVRISESTHKLVLEGPLADGVLARLKAAGFSWEDVVRGFKESPHTAISTSFINDPKIGTLDNAIHVRIVGGKTVRITSGGGTQAYNVEDLQRVSIGSSSNILKIEVPDYEVLATVLSRTRRNGISPVMIIHDPEAKGISWYMRPEGRGTSRALDDFITTDAIFSHEVEHRFPTQVLDAIDCGYRVQAVIGNFKDFDAVINDISLGIRAKLSSPVEHLFMSSDSMRALKKFAYARGMSITAIDIDNIVLANITHPSEVHKFTNVKDALKYLQSLPLADTLQDVDPALLEIVMKEADALKPKLGIPERVPNTYDPEAPEADLVLPIIARLRESSKIALDYLKAMLPRHAIAQDLEQRWQKFGINIPLFKMYQHFHEVRQRVPYEAFKAVEHIYDRLKAMPVEQQDKLKQAIIHYVGAPDDIPLSSSEHARRALWISQNKPTDEELSLIRDIAEFYESEWKKFGHLAKDSAPHVWGYYNRVPEPEPFVRFQAEEEDVARYALSRPMHWSERLSAESRSDEASLAYSLLLYAYKNRRFDALSPVVTAINQMLKAVKSASDNIDRPLKAITALFLRRLRNDIISGTTVPSSQMYLAFNHITNTVFGWEKGGAEKFLEHVTPWMYMTAMGYRIGTPIRNLLSLPLQLVPVVGFRQFARGASLMSEYLANPERYQAFMDPVVTSFLRRFEDTHRRIIEELYPKAGAEKYVDKLYRHSLVLMRKTEEFNRVYVWLTGLDTAEKIAARIASGESIGKVVMETPLAFFDKPATDRLLGILESRGEAEFRKQFAAELIRCTMWSYGPGETPLVIPESTFGRLLTMFGTWPLNHINYLRRGIVDGFVVEDGKRRLTPFGAKFIARYVAIQAAMYLGFKSAGIAPGNLLGISAVEYTGGPFASLLGDVFDWVRFQGSEEDAAWNRLKRSGLQAILPLQGVRELARGLRHVDRDEPWYATAHFFGFTPQEEIEAAKAAAEVKRMRNKRASRTVRRGLHEPSPLTELYNVLAD